jgi:hypothetical protein
MFEVIGCWLACGLFCFGTFQSLWNGEFRWRDGPTVSRADSPAEYWFWTAIFGLATCFILCMAVAITIGVK